MIYLLPSPVIAVIEGTELQFACGPFINELPPPILEVNGAVITAVSDPQLTIQDFPGVNRTYVYSSVQRIEDGSEFQCFSDDRSLSSNISVLVVYCEFHIRISGLRSIVG